MGPGPDGRSLHVVFVFSSDLVYPPSVDNIKVHYVSQELIGMGDRVTWLTINGSSCTPGAENVRLVCLNPRTGRIGWYLRLFDLVRYCRREGADCVYADEWLFLRDRPLQRLLVQIGLRIAGIKYVFDQRDPYIDHRIATRTLEEGSAEHRLLTAVYRLASRFTDLAIYPSEAYAKQSAGTLGRARSTIGVIRGVDLRLFNPGADGSGVRSRLGLDGRFVVGWFGMMNPSRQIEEVLIPLIRDSKDSLPDASFVIGGRGRLRPVLEKLVAEVPKANIILLGYVDYAELPSHIAACDVILCPLNLEHSSSRMATPLKIVESLAVARPVIATETAAREEDYADLDGVVWTGAGFEDFRRALVMVHGQYGLWRQRAARQAEDFMRYSKEHGISRIVNAIREACS